MNPEIDVTKFVNITDVKFVFYIGGQPREVEAHEEKPMPIYVATHGAKHLIDKILQEKYGVKNTLADTEIRRSLLAQILPELAEEKNVKPLPPEEFQRFVEKRLGEEKKQIEGLTKLVEDKKKDAEDKDKLLEKALKEIEDLKKKLNKPAAKSSVVPKVEETKEN